LRSSANAILDRENPIATRFFDELRKTSATQEFDESKFPSANFDAAYKLVGFAIENFLKGIAIAKGPATFAGQKLPEKLKTHTAVRHV
jgi:hypothetical protein